MARKVKGGGKRKARARVARPRAVPAKRLPNGSYAWKGKAIPFSRLPKAEQSRFRASWAAKATKERAAAARKDKGSKDARAAREWVKRRSVKLGVEGDARYRSAADIVATVPASEILAARERQKEAHALWVRQGKHGGGNALIIADEIRTSLGAEIAAAMPQLWWYH